jgi:hypothetical protein
MKYFISIKIIVFDIILYEGLIAQFLEIERMQVRIFLLPLLFFIEKANFLKFSSDNFH